MDIAIAVGLGVVTLALAYLGVNVTLHPPDTKGKTTAYKVGFSVLSLVAIGLTLWLAWRNSEAESRLRLASECPAASPQETSGHLGDHTLVAPVRSKPMRPFDSLSIHPYTEDELNAGE